jgi:DNA end-binding protein Ku
VFYANEVRAYDDVELGPDQAFSEAEEALAAQLISSLSVDAFDPHKYRDEYATRVLKAAEQKTAGQEVTLAPEQPAAQIIDLFEALKQSLSEAQSRTTSSEEQPVAVAAAGGAPAPAPERPGPAASTRSRSSAGRSPKKA